METIPKELVTKTWQGVGSMNKATAIKAMNALSKKQNDLLAFMLQFTQDLEQEVQELAIYIFFVVYRMFEKHATKKIKKIPAEKIIAAFDEYQDFLEGLEHAHEKFIERRAEVESEKQPHVQTYVLEALMEDDSDLSIELTEDNIGYLYILLKTVIDVLDETTE